MPSASFSQLKDAISAGVQMGMSASANASASPAHTAQSGWASMTKPERVAHLGNQQFFMNQMMSQGRGAAGAFGLAGSMMPTPGAGMAMSAIGMGIDATSSGMRFGAGVVNTMSNASMTGSQKFSAIAESAPIVGDLVKSFRELKDAVSGVTEGLRRNKEEHEFRMVSNQARNDATFATGNYRLHAAFARNRANALSGVGVPAFGGYDRSTAAGERQHADAMRLTSFQDAERMARAEADAAGSNATAARGRVSEIDRQLSRLRSIRGNREGQRGSLINPRGANGDAGLEALGRSRNEQGLIEGNTSIAQLEGQRITALQQAQQAATEAINAENRARQANIGTMREELSLLREKEGRISGNATRIGRMSIVSRRRGLSAIRMLERVGPDRMPRSLLADAEAFDPTAAGMAFRNHGENTAEYGARAGEGGFGGDTERLSDVQGRADSLFNRIRSQSVESSQLAANQIADVFERFFNSFREAIEGRFQAIERRTRASQILGHTTQGR